MGRARPWDSCHAHWVQGDRHSSDRGLWPEATGTSRLSFKAGPLLPQATQTASFWGRNPFKWLLLASHVCLNSSKEGNPWIMDLKKKRWEIGEGKTTHNGRKAL